MRRLPPSWLLSIHCKTHVALNIASRVRQSCLLSRGQNRVAPRCLGFSQLGCMGIYSFCALLLGHSWALELVCGDLGYAADAALLVTRPDGLQSLMDAAPDFCEQISMQICADQTNFVKSVLACLGYMSGIAGGPLLVQHHQYLGAVLGGVAGKLQQDLLGASAPAQAPVWQIAAQHVSWGPAAPCVPPTASCGCEVWRLHVLSNGVSRMGQGCFGHLTSQLLR